MQRKYDVVLTFIFPNQQESYVIWDIEMYSQIRNTQKFIDFVLDGDKNGFGVNPIAVHASIYLNAQVQEITTPMGNELIIVGKKILLLDSY